MCVLIKTKGLEKGCRVHRKAYERGTIFLIEGTQKEGLFCQKSVADPDLPLKGAQSGGGGGVIQTLR